MMYKSFFMIFYQPTFLSKSDGGAARPVGSIELLIYMDGSSLILSSLLYPSVTGTDFGGDSCAIEWSCHTKVYEPSAAHYLPIAEEKIIGFIPFPRVLAQRQIKTALSRNRTRVTVSISFNDKHYTTSTLHMYVWLFVIFFPFLLSSFINTVCLFFIYLSICPVGWGCRIHRLSFCKEVRLPN